jgi:hypothetical protein
MEHSCRLLFVGGDFSKTDVVSVLQPGCKTAARGSVERLHVDWMRQSCSIRLRIL